jgi:hypothetical protein
MTDLAFSWQMPGTMAASRRWSVDELGIRTGRLTDMLLLGDGDPAWLLNPANADCTKGKVGIQIVRKECVCMCARMRVCVCVCVCTCSCMRVRVRVLHLHGQQQQRAQQAQAAAHVCHGRGGLQLLARQLRGRPT